LEVHIPGDGRHRLLAEGQALLMARREAIRLARERSGDAPALCDPAPEPSKQLNVNSKQLAKMAADLPDHLGWGSAAQTAVLRASAKRHLDQPQTIDGSNRSPDQLPPPEEPRITPHEKQEFSASDTVSLAPSLGLAILRKKQAAPARLWLILRAIDENGRGMVSLEQAKKALTEQESPLHFCGYRQLRNLLDAGGDIFWEFDGGRIWLRSTARAAEALQVPHFHGKDVALPVSELTGGIAAVRANLYAAFHSGRAARPISRQSLAGKSGVAPRTQRHYDRLIGVEKQTNYARGAIVGSEAGEEQAWQQGPASFTWRVNHKRQKDHNGRLMAWQLPNSYHGPHAQLGRGRQKRQNKALADLLNKGTTGNSHSQKDDLHSRYFADARAATSAFCDSDTPVYWPDLKPGLWHCLWPQNNQKLIKRNKK
jgi:hypothetical protein